MSKKFVPGVRVCSKFDNYIDAMHSSHGVVVDTAMTLTENTIAVQWDPSYDGAPSYPPVIKPTANLMLEQDAKDKNSKLEAEYNALAKEVKAKMKEAGKLIKDCHKLAKKAGYEGLNEMAHLFFQLLKGKQLCSN